MGPILQTDMTCPKFVPAPSILTIIWSCHLRGRRFAPGNKVRQVWPGDPITGYEGKGECAFNSASNE